MSAMLHQIFCDLINWISFDRNLSFSRTIIFLKSFNSLLDVLSIFYTHSRIDVLFQDREWSVLLLHIRFSPGSDDHVTLLHWLWKAYMWHCVLYTDVLCSVFETGDFCVLTFVFWVLVINIHMARMSYLHRMQHNSYSRFVSAHFLSPSRHPHICCRSLYRAF